MIAVSLEGDVPQLVTMLVAKGWSKCMCSICGKTFFSKQSSIEGATCGRNDCAADPYAFLKLPKQKKKVVPIGVYQKLAYLFLEAGFASQEALGLINETGKTDLVIAGVQMYDGVIHGGYVVDKTQYFIAQPCVRMQFQSRVEEQDGISTAFVNICTEQAGGNFQSHLRSIDVWLDALSALGLHMNDVSLVLRRSGNDWGTGSFESLELFFCYGGLELGDANYACVPNCDGVFIPISDIGFGLERLCWAINKTEAYYDLLTPWFEHEPREKLDACRTIALLALSDIQAGNKGPGLQFRRFAKVLSEKYYGTSVLPIVSHYLDYWALFADVLVEEEQALLLVETELDRLFNLRLKDHLRIPPIAGESTKDYLDRLVYRCNVNVQEVHNAIRICTA